MTAAWMLLSLLACQGEARVYEMGTPSIAARYNAKEACSCLFVMDRTVESCEHWLRVSPDIATFTVDEDAATVTTRVVRLGWKATARYVSAEEGCLLEGE